MKELSLEEKAKAYDEAIKKAKRLYEQGTITESLSYVFPELKESEDERVRNTAINACKYMVDNFENSTKQYEDAIAWLETQGEQKSIDDLTPQEAMDIAVAKCFEQGEQKLVWGEEDERKIDLLEALIEDAKADSASYSTMAREMNELSSWLKSLKDKIQPKQEWSEQEQVRINRIVAYLENLNVADNDILLKDVAWLKSLRPQNTWKPSEEQIMYIGEAIDLAEKSEKFSVVSVLKDIREQLKKLREE